MSEQQEEVPTAYCKVDLIPYRIGEPLPEVEFSTDLDTDSSFVTKEGLERQIENFKKDKPGQQDMKLIVIRRMTEDEVANMKNSKHEPVSGETFREMLNFYRANKAKEALNGNQ